MNKRTNRLHGFTLIELAIAIFIIALLMGSILVPLATQVEQRQVSETQKTLDDIRDALLGFAVANGYLPCPDLQLGVGSNDGIEDVVANRCPNLVTVAGVTFVSGNLPWSTIGLANKDVWGNRFRYTVVENFARRDSLFNMTTTSGLRVCSTSACATQLTSTAVAIFISHGNNGRGAINASTNIANLAPTSGDEIENTDNDRDAVSRDKSNVVGNEFDDIVVWLPRFTLLNRMVTAGKLP